MTSNPFKSIPQRYIHKLATEWVARHWLVLIAPITAAIIWAIMDVKAIYVVLILVFIVYPLAITFVWFNYALSPRSIKAITEKQVTVVDEGLKIDYLPAREDAPAIRSDFIAWRDVLSAEFTPDSIDLILGSKLDDRINLPVDSFSDAAWSVIMKNVSSALPQTDMD